MIHQGFGKGGMYTNEMALAGDGALQRSHLNWHVLLPAERFIHAGRAFISKWKNRFLKRNRDERGDKGKRDKGKREEQKKGSYMTSG